jgi:hypothetical protein
MPTAPQLEFLYHLHADLGQPVQIGDVARGQRMIVPVTAGTVEGSQINGKVLPGAADWLLIRTDGVGELDVRATIETNDGALLYLTYRGYVTNVPEIMPLWLQGQEVPRDSYYFAVTPYFETSSPQHAWLQRTVVVGTGSLVPGGVDYDVFAVK